jgi:broad specificity phosphatase PhoE
MIAAMKKRVYLIRHAMPQQPYHGRYDLPPGPGLSDVGRQQADQLGQFLQDKGIERVYHSPLLRALQTAVIVSDYTQLPSQQQEALAEWRQGETAVMTRERVVQFWRETVMANGAAVTAVVTHGGLIDQMLGYLSDDQLDLSQHRYWGGPSAPLAGVWRAELGDGDGRWRLDLIFNPELERGSQ